MAVKLYHGDIVYTPSADALAVYENRYIAVDSGKVEGIYPVIPEKYKHAECIDYGRQMIIPAFSDLHVHGAQYVQRGIGMDCLLSDCSRQTPLQCRVLRPAERRQPDIL